MAERDSDFCRFRELLERHIAAIGMPAFGTKEHDEAQRAQVDRLAAMELDFRDALVAHPKLGEECYRRFVSEMCDVRRNILSARPYFRERKETFSERISGALKVRDWKALQAFHPNHTFFALVMKGRKWPRAGGLAKKAAALRRHRDQLVTANLPLAINWAHGFYDRAVRGRSSLSSMDVVDIFAEGLISGADKYVGPWKRVWRSVVIGRGVGYGIESNSATFLHFYPPDRRAIYRGNKARATSPEADPQLVLMSVNEGVEGPAMTAAELAELMAAAASPASAEAPVDAEGKRTLSDSFAAPDECRPDVAAEANERAAIGRAALDSLSVFERKVLALKTGVLSL